MLAGLYAIVDVDRASGRDPRSLARAALVGGCAVLQLRAKSLPDAPLLALARAIATDARALSVPFVVNDRPDLARLAGAWGVHLGQDDLATVDARTIAPGLCIGRSTHDAAQVTRAHAEGADLLAMGPVLPTRSKANPDPVVGLEGVAMARRLTSRPLVAIGGITAETAPAVRAAGADLGAVIAGWSLADDPEQAARALHLALGGTPPTDAAEAWR